MKVLLVDDCVDIVNILASFLELSDHEVDKASNGIEAIALLRKNVYDVVITDSEMPGMDGSGLCRFIRSEIPDLFIIGISGSSRSLEKLRTAGADVCFAKPFRIDEIEQAMEERFHAWPLTPGVPAVSAGREDAHRLSRRFGTTAYR